MHVYELRRKYNDNTNNSYNNKEFIELLDSLGIKEKKATSSLSEDEIKKVNDYFNKNSNSSEDSKPDIEEKNQDTKLLIVNKGKKEEEEEPKKKKKPLKVKKAKAKHIVGSPVVKKKVVKKAVIHKTENKKEENKEESKNDNIKEVLKDNDNETNLNTIEAIEDKIEESDKGFKKSIDNKKEEKTFKEHDKNKSEKDDHKKNKSNDKSSDKDSKKGKTHRREKVKKIILSKHGNGIKKEYRKDDKDKKDNRDKKDDFRKNKKFKKEAIKPEITSEETFAQKPKRNYKDKATKKREKTQPEEKSFQLKKKKPKEKTFKVPDTIEITETISVADLAKKMNIKSNILIAKFMQMGELVTINQVIDSDTAQLIADEFDCKVKVISLLDETKIEEEKDDEKDLVERSPIVTVMGHVDHGKTKLLDAIRSTNKVDSEFGGITQHIGAYKIKTSKDREVVFLDTPGHEAFTSMRKRGAKVTDIVVLVVAADDGVMPQTVEAINHAKSAEVPIIVAINKIDTPGANVEKVKTRLSEFNLIADDWGGDTYMVEVSALKKININDLLETILFKAEELELKANPNKLAVGSIIESKIDPGRGPVATVIVQAGTLKIGSIFVAGVYKGKVRAMFDDNGKAIEEAGPSTPVEVLGIDGVPEAGDPFQEVNEEKYAKQISSKRQSYKRHEEAMSVTHVTLDTLFGAIEDGKVKELNLIVKADVQGSVEALKEYFEKLSTINKEVRVSVKHSATGGINESDVLLASASGAIIIGFNVRANQKAADLAIEEGIEIRRYNVIYDAVEEIKAAMEGLLPPEQKENIIGQLEVRDTFKISKIGTIAGCYVTNGYITRHSKVRLIRDDVVVYDGTLGSLKRFKNDVAEVREGFECGLSIDKFNDLKVGDIIEAYIIKEVARKL